jgi:hypothetical protein
MNRILRTALIVCVVGIATESRADVNVLRGALHHWRDVEDVGIEYTKDVRELGGSAAEDSINGIETALEVACELLRGRFTDKGLADRIQKFAGSTDEGHKKYNDGTTEAQNFVVMVVMLTKMIDALLYANESNPVQNVCNGLLVRKEGVTPWWQGSNPPPAEKRRSVKPTILLRTASYTSKASNLMSI